MLFFTLQRSAWSVRLNRSKEFPIKAQGLLICSMTLGVALNAQAGSARCLDVYTQVENRVERSTQYEKDFGAGVFVHKVGNKEIRIEPPLEVVTSIRQAQLAVGKRAQGGGAAMTVLFGGFSEGEVIGFRAMLLRDSKIKDDETLTSILLGSEMAPSRDYDSVRNLAIAARDRMNRRYEWAKATIESKASEAGDREERYLLTAPYGNRPEEFLLKIRIRMASVLKNRVAQLATILSKPTLFNATSEQVALEMISSLKKSDPGVTAVTLKVIAGDFVIAGNK